MTGDAPLVVDVGCAAERLGTNPGLDLTSAESARRREETGPNELGVTSPPIAGFEGSTAATSQRGWAHRRPFGC